MFVYMTVYNLRSCKQIAQITSWEPTPYRLSATSYSLYWQLHSILVAVLTSAGWRRAMPWLLGPIYWGDNCIYNVTVYRIYALIMKHINCRCQIWPITKANAEKPKYSKRTGGVSFTAWHQ